jgi:hypothetical protein
MTPDLTRMTPDLTRIAPDLTRITPDLTQITRDLTQTTSDSTQITSDSTQITPIRVGITPIRFLISTSADCLKRKWGLKVGTGLTTIDGMILRVSAAFSKQFKFVLSHPGESVPQERRLDAWSCHFIRVRRKPLVVVMNDATLYTLILPVTGVKGFPELWLKLLGRIGEVWTRHGVHFDPDNQAVVLFSRTNRSLIGSMNDAIVLIRIYDEDARTEQVELDLAAMETRSNQTPYKALNYEWPERLMALALRERPC